MNEKEDCFLSFYKEFEKQCRCDIEAFKKIKKARTDFSRNEKDRIELFLSLLSGDLNELITIAVEHGTITQNHFDVWRSSKIFLWTGFYSLFISSLTLKNKRTKSNDQINGKINISLMK